LNALDWFRPRQAHFDAILICRGGGSRTDLAWFDTEALGRAVALYPIPILCGIGHEQDVSVLDHVARHAKTPTAAAAFFVDAVRSALERAEDLARSIFDEALALIATERRNRRDATQRLARGTTRWIEASRAQLAAAARQVGQGARRDLAGEARRVHEAMRAIAPRATRALAQEGERVALRARRLYLLDPRRVVERGYAILRGADGRVVLDPKQAQAGARVTAELRSGRLGLVVEGTNDE
jgi:exodeoxyribonuclease VII large subunit